MAAPKPREKDDDETPAPPHGSLKVVALKDGFYPKDVRRRRNSIFTLQKKEHFSDGSRQRVIKRKDGTEYQTGLVGWMAWADPGATERAVTQEEAAKEKLGARPDAVI